MTNATQFPLNSREWAKWLESRVATAERSVGPTAARIANEIAWAVVMDPNAPGGGGGGGGTTYQVFTPIGMPVPWLTDDIPEGFVEYNGQLLPRAAPYDQLFSVLGTKYGIGDGSTTFGTPNMKARTIIGRDSADPAMDLVGDTGGEKTHTLTIGEIPAHTHDVVSVASDGSTGTDNYPLTGTKTKPARISGTAGGGGAHNNMPPYMTGRWIARYLDVETPLPTTPVDVLATPNTLVLRDNNGRSQIVAPTIDAEIANKGYADTQDAATLAAANAHSDAADTATLNSAKAYADAGDVTTLNSSKAYTDSQMSGGAPGTPLPTPSTTMKRDVNGRAQVVAPVVPDDIATKKYVDDTVAGGSGTPLPTPSTLMSRDANGRSQVVDPANSADIATMRYANGTSGSIPVAVVTSNSWVVADSIVNYDLTVTAGAPATINGILRSATRAGRYLVMRCALASPFSITFNHESTAATANDRMTLPDGLPITITPGQSVTFYYNGGTSRWVVLTRQMPSTAHAVVVSTGPPAATDVVWVDSDEPGGTGSAGSGQAVPLTGLWMPLWPYAGAFATGTVGAGQHRITKAVLTADAQAFAIEVSSVAATTVKVAVYADSAGVPGALLYTSAAIDVSASVGIKTVPLAVPAGTYWVAVQNVGGVSFGMRVVSGFNPLLPGSDTPGANAQTSAWQLTGQGATLPPTFPVGSASHAAVMPVTYWQAT